MQLISAYAPPTFLKPALVFITCICPERPHGHLMVYTVEAFNGDRAIGKVFSARGDDRVGLEAREVEVYASTTKAVQRHLTLTRAMQNGQSGKVWRRGYEPYLRLLEAYDRSPTFWGKEDMAVFEGTEMGNSH